MKTFTIRGGSSGSQARTPQIYDIITKQQIVMRELYLKIIEMFESNRETFVEKELSPFETIDLYDGQTDEPNNFEFTCPAVFIDYSVEWERGGNALKKGVIDVEMHILTHPGMDTESFNPKLPDGLKKLDYYNLVTELMENVSTDNISNLALISERPAITDYFCYHILKFNSTIYRDKRKNYTKLSDVKPDFQTSR